MRRWLVVAAVGMALTGAGCGRHAHPTPAAASPDAKVVRAAAASAPPHSSLFSPFARQPAQGPCSIPRGGQKPGTVIAGVCATQVSRDGSGWTVAFVESWDAAQFHNPPSPPVGRLVHVWTIHLDAAGKVVGQQSAGDFPPQQAA